MLAHFSLSFLTLLLFSTTQPLTLTIEIKELRSNDGMIMLEFNDAQKNTLKAVEQEIQNNTCVIKISDLKPGDYSFRYFHDANNNKELDTNFMGMPTEGYGFSNNASGTLGPPAHKKTLFTVKSDTTVQCTPHYLKKN